MASESWRSVLGVMALAVCRSLSGLAPIVCVCVCPHTHVLYVCGIVEFFNL